MNFKFWDAEQFQTMLKPIRQPTAWLDKVERPQVRVVENKEVKELDSWSGEGPFRCLLQ